MNKHITQYGVAFIAGLATVFGFAPYYFFIVPMMALAVLIYWHAKANSPKQSFWLGASYGLGLYTVGIYWIYISLHTFGGMPPIFAAFCTFCLCAFMALFPALALWLSKRLGSVVISAPVLWALSDWVRSWIFTGFPWLTMGYSQVPNSPLAGFAPVFGIYGISLLVVLLAAMLACTLAQQQSVIWKRNVIASTMVILVTGLFLKAYPWSQAVGQPTSVALIQGNVSQLLKWSPEHAQNTIDLYTRMVNESDAELTIVYGKWRILK